MDEKTERRPLVRWRCKGCGRTLGVVKTARLMGREASERVLLVLPGASEADDAEILAAVHERVVRLVGYGLVTCSECGAVREWVLGQAQLDARVEKVLERQKSKGISDC